VQRLAIVGLILTVVFSGHAIALCAQDCADASIASEQSLGTHGGNSEGSCHGDNAIPQQHSKSPANDAPQTPRPKNCAGHAQSIFVAARVAKIRAFAPRETFVTIVAGQNVHGLPFVQVAGQASEISPIPLLDSSPRAIALRI
jgi:hypothetical protein